MVFYRKHAETSLNAHYGIIRKAGDENRLLYGSLDMDSN
jgi:hypothetical protein